MKPVTVSTLTRALSAGLAALLASCGGGAPDTPICAYRSGNLIDDPAFVSLDAPRSQRRWRFSEHAAGGSFVYAAANGVLNIRQEGIEPWGLVKQTVESKPLRGRVVEFTAELKLDLSDPEARHSFKLGGGLSLTAKHNGRLQLSSLMDHEPHLGKHDWFTARVVTALPRRMNFLEVGFIHQAGGELWVRNPALRVVADDCPTSTPEEN